MLIQPHSCFIPSWKGCSFQPDKERSRIDRLMQSNMEFSRISVTALWRFERKQMTVQDQKHAKRLMIFQDQPEILKNSLFFFFFFKHWAFLENGSTQSIWYLWKYQQQSYYWWVSLLEMFRFREIFKHKRKCKTFLKITGGGLAN